MKHQKSIWASCLILGLEAYDAFVFVFLSQSLQSIFSTQSASFSLFILTVFLSIFVRSMGGIYLGHFSDQYGRRPVMIVTILFMSFLTLCFILTPLLKIYAPAYLVFFITVLKAFQGMTFGSNMVVTNSYLFELAPTGRRGFFASLAQASQEIGIILAATVAICFYSMPVKEWMSETSWRIPFISGILSILLGLYLRSHLIESPHIHFKAMKPLKVIFKTFKMQILKVFMLAPLEIFSFYIFRVYILSQAYIYLNVSVASILFLLLISSLTSLVFILIGSVLSDLVGRKPVLISGALGVLFLSWPTLVLINHPGEANMIFIRMFVGQLMIGLFVGLYKGALSGLMAEMFPAKIRGTGCSLSYNLAASVVAGIFPFCNFFSSVINKSNTILGTCLTISALVALVVLSIGIKETYKIRHDEWIEK